MRRIATQARKIIPLAGLMATGMILWATPAVANMGEATSASTTPTPAVASLGKATSTSKATTAAPATSNKISPMRKTSPYRPEGLPDSGKAYYQSLWGVDDFVVRSTASGNLIRFSYRVTDPARAKLLGDKKATPYLFGHRSRAMLQIPVMSKVGELRQTGAPQAGKEYWMVFSNKGNLVKPGDRVSVIIGSFHIDGLMVE